MKKLSIAITAILIAVGNSFAAMTIQLWHGYRADEKVAIEEVTKSFNLSHSDIQVKLLAVPFDALNDKLRSTIPARTGPDVFVFAQDFVGGWAENNIIQPIESYVSEEVQGKYFRNTLRAFNYGYEGALWALPSSFKNIALYYNKDLVRNPPQKMSEVIDVAKKFTNPKAGQLGKWGFVYETGNFYYHTMWVQGFGGKIFKRIGEQYAGGPPVFLPLLYSEPMIRAGKYVQSVVQKAEVCPVGPDGTLITRLFNSGNAMFVINGQWFRGEIDKRINYGLSKLPVIDEVGNRAIPFLTVEGYFMSGCCRDERAAAEVITYYTSAAMGRTFAKIGKQTPANRDTYTRYTEVSSDPIAQIFKDAAGVAVSMPNTPEMALTWDPATSGLNDILGGADPTEALKKRQIQLMNSIDKGLYGGKNLYRNVSLNQPLSVN